MSFQYDQYLARHRANVKRGFDWLSENLPELTQAISKQIRGYDNRIGLLEEMADAYICLEFLKSIFNITPEELQKAMDVKLQRERNKQR